MKDWFEYEYGFVNIDDENIYLTESGNWSETKNLHEQTPNNKVSEGVNKFLTILFLGFVFLAIIGIMILKFSASFRFGIIGGIGLISGGIAVWNFLKSDFGSNFYIPISKLEKIEVGDDYFVLFFLDKSGKASTYSITKPEPKGFEIIKKVLLNKHNLKS